MNAVRRPEWAALARAICEKPGDDLRRLVAADWLEEQGDEAHAEFVRAGVAEAPRQVLVAICEGLHGDTPRLVTADGPDGIVSPWRMAQGGGALDPPSERAQDLWSEHADSWLWPLPALLQGVLQWGALNRRGFVDFLQLPPGAFIQDAAAIFQYHPVTRAHLRVGGPGEWSWDRTCVGDRSSGRYHSAELLDEDMTARGAQSLRVPGPIFPYLAGVGTPCKLRGSRAIFARPVLGREAVSRAAVAFGRARAGLPPLTWPDDL
jgi:uncharacterized protein (TIGR02996 family)